MLDNLLFMLFKAMWAAHKLILSFNLCLEELEIKLQVLHKISKELRILSQLLKNKYLFYKLIFLKLKHKL